MVDQPHNSIELILALLSRNHHLLDSLGLSHPEIERIISAAKSEGWTGKITGSGMGGCVLLVAPKG
jgi:mevalonate kinase